MKKANAAIFVPHAGCPHRCGFCNQRRITGGGRIPTGDEVARTLAAAAESLGERARESEIAFFGGSFTAIDRADMLALLRAAGPFLGKTGFSGIRVSTRPDAVDTRVLDLLAAHGVTAVELGAQCMDDGVLARCGRGHTEADVVRAADLVRGRGLSLGLQMMTGLPGADDAADRATARAFLRLCPDTVRVYPTLVLEDTDFADLWRAGGYTPPPLDAAVDLCAGLLKTFAAAGVRVIRMGLHDTGDLRESVLAGPRHPAFRELCEGRVLLGRALEALADIPPGPVLLTVAPGAASKMAGHNRRNTRELEARGYRPKILEDAAAGYLEVRVEAPGPAHTRSLW